MKILVDANFFIFILVLLPNCVAAIMSSSALKRTILWFRNDLRIHDNPILTAAARQLAMSGGDHLCLYCFDPRHFCSTPYGSAKTGVYRAKYLTEAVDNLKKNLRTLGSDLIITFGVPEEVIPSFIENHGEADVFVHGEVTSEEIDVEFAVERALKPLKSRLNRIYGGNMLYHVDDLPYQSDFRDMPDTFTLFKDKVEKRCSVRDLLPSVTSSSLIRSAAVCLEPEVREKFSPALSELGFDSETIARATGSLDRRGVMVFTGGEDSALERIRQWIFEEDKLKDYFDIRNGMLGSEYSSKLSPALAHGCVSARKIFSEVRRYEAERGISNKSTYWLIFELIWRDFFRCLCAKYGRRIFFAGGAIGKNVKWSHDTALLHRWKSGLTGLPLVDANMRELAATGWMSNRGRQNVASYLVLDCGIDWRMGADHFESLLLDHDVCSNYGNWNAAAGLTGGRVNKFNIAKQNRDYDPDGAYIRHWLPELRNVPAPMIFEPWKLSEADQDRFGIKIGSGDDCTYPSPLDTTPISYRKTEDHVTGQTGSSGSNNAHRENRSTGKQNRSWNTVSKRGRVQHF